jgi:hypothetical protein
MVVLQVSYSHGYQIARSLRYKFMYIQRVVKTATEEHDRDKGRRWRMKKEVEKIDTASRLLCVGVDVMKQKVTDSSRLPVIV